MRKFKLPSSPKVGKALPVTGPVVIEQPTTETVVLKSTKYSQVKVFIPPYDAKFGGPSGIQVLANVAGALKKANIPPEEVAAFYKEAGASKNYGALLSTIKRWVTVT